MRFLAEIEIAIRKFKYAVASDIQKQNERKKVYRPVQKIIIRQRRHDSCFGRKQEAEIVGG
jgi:hypothetical protein